MTPVDKALLVSAEQILRINGYEAEAGAVGRVGENLESAERERCAKLCEEAREAVWPYHDAEVFKVAQTVCENLAKRIRGIGA